ncbi:MAG TPA: hypothetical protein PK039_04855, partial [Prolixibacteraceae bacterium]|nr:hypothetical protein [Prolixibacteraceae bacterium]
WFLLNLPSCLNFREYYTTTWPIFSELSRHYLDKEYTFNLLLSLVYNEKTFYNGIQPEMPPPAPTNY